MEIHISQPAPWFGVGLDAHDKVARADYYVARVRALVAAHYPGSLVEHTFTRGLDDSEETSVRVFASPREASLSSEDRREVQEAIFAITERAHEEACALAKVITVDPSDEVFEGQIVEDAFAYDTIVLDVDVDEKGGF